MYKPYTVRALRQLAALASPGREDIIDAVDAIGPCSVAEVARFLGRSRYALYYHVQALSRCGLLLECRAPRSRGRAARYDVPGHPVRVRYDLSSAAARRAVIAIGRARLRGAARGFVRACRPNAARLWGAQRELWVARRKGWLTPLQLREANRLLVRLARLLRQEGDATPGAARCYEFTFALAPCIPQPERRAAASKPGGAPAATRVRRARRGGRRVR
jgi:hypothetical protein